MSIKQIGFIALLLAVGVLFLHNTLPHTHHTESDEMLHNAEHQEANSLLDYLRLAFHIDLGGDHLENFEHANELAVDAPPVHLLNSYTTTTLKNKAENKAPSFQPLSEWFFPPQHFWEQIYFRGPPRV